MAANEYSERALALTEDLIDMNPAHYTVWLYRARVLFALNSDLRQELEWLNETALDHQKNYQIWHHRMLVVDKLDDCEGEGEFVERMFEKDAKNYHVWSYRQWLVKRFGLWEKGELEFTEKLIERDVRNNSAWNHRWYVINGREVDVVPGVTDERIRDREVEFAKNAAAKAPQNQCPWNYLRGIAKKSGMSLASLKDFVSQYASVDRPDAIRSSHALDFMADILATEEDGKQQAGVALDMLAQKYDPIRKNYWEYRKGVLGLPTAA
jgi:protein farnesyltransferase/geranylgeranyltransferase type-1 subunit alpha